MGSLGHHHRLLSTLVLLAGVLLLGADCARAQSIWTPRLDGGSVRVEVYRPSFDGAPDLTLATSLWYVTARLPVSDQALLEFDLPFSHLGVEDGGSSSSIGNPHLGLELRAPGSNASVQFSTRLPLADENEAPALFLGSFGDLSRWEAWIDEILPMTLLARYQNTDDRGLGLRFDVGPTIWFATDDRRDTEILALYAVQGVYVGEQAQVGIGLHGRAILSADDFDLGESTLHEFGATACFRAGNAWPGLHLRIPLDDDLSELVDATVGLQVSFEIGPTGS